MKKMQTNGAVKNFIKNSSIGMKVGIVLFMLASVLAVVLAMVYVGRNQEKAPGIPITNFQEISSAPEEYQINTEQLIWILAERNESIGDLSQYSAVIREGSYSEDVEKKTRKAHFIVDIEELRYSFEVTMSWIEGGRKNEELYVEIRCPYYTDVIYPETQCIAETPEAQIRRYLPHNEYMENGKLVHVEESSVGKDFRLLVKVEACKDQNILDAAKNQTQEWIETLYMDSEDFAIEPYDTCAVGM